VFGKLRNKLNEEVVLVASSRLLEAVGGGCFRRFEAGLFEFFKLGADWTHGVRGFVLDFALVDV
jgi:hypothetical protein